jgi:hypothetical protein
MAWITLLVIIIILGALAGGNTLGETIRSGCGCLVMIIVVILAITAINGVPL